MNLFKLRRPQPSLDDLTADFQPRARHQHAASERLMPAAERPSPVFVRGQGSWVWDSEERAYLDFSQGGGSNSLGHSPGVLAHALADQAHGLINVGAGFHNPVQSKLADRLCQATHSDQVYFLNSGSEACEAAIKLARKWGQLHRGGAYRIISASNACHGRSFGAMSASGQDCFGNRFEPQLPGFSQVPFNDLEALHAAVDAKTVAIMLEPIQRAAGVTPATRDYLKGVEQLCRTLGILLIFDEVQTGIGRCGSLLAEQLYDVRADIIALGKGLGGGAPLSALLARGKACCFETGEIGGSHHGNALMSAAGLAVLETLLKHGLARFSRRGGRTWPVSAAGPGAAGAALRTGRTARCRAALGVDPERCLLSGPDRQPRHHRRNAAAPGPRLLPCTYRAGAMPQGYCRLTQPVAFS